MATRPSKDDPPAGRNEEKGGKPQRTSRRTLLARGVGAATALGLAGAGGAAAAAGDPLVLGQINDAGGAGTALLASSDAAPGLTVDNAGAGSALYGKGASGVGVQGRSDEGSGVRGESSSGYGVEGRGRSAQGVFGHSEFHTGVTGNSVSDHGVYGQSNNGPGVGGRSLGGAPGVYGESVGGYGVTGHTEGGGRSGAGVMGLAPGETPGVRAISGNSSSGGPPVLDQGLALDVVGGARFSGPSPQLSTAAVETIPVGASRHVCQLRAEPGGLVVATLQGFGGVGVAVGFVQVPPGGGAPTIYLTRPTTRAVNVGYLVLRPAPATSP